ncbi:MAG: hypothetical protein WD184_01560 [Acidimicrobiia bacterium]
MAAERRGPVQRVSSKDESAKRDYDERTSLHPMTFDQALRGLLSVKVPSDDTDTSESDDK